eukprot:752585-Hanusia_phi.AAC.3
MSSLSWRPRRVLPAQAELCFSRAASFQRFCKWPGLVETLSRYKGCMCCTGPCWGDRTGNRKSEEESEES